MAHPNFKLSYFNARGFAEMSRFVFAYAGVSYEDIRYEHDATWAEAKPKYEWGMVPVLEIDGKQLAQSKAIVRYLGKKYNLAGSDEFETAKCDEIIESLSDLRSSCTFFYTEKDDKKKAELTAALKADTVPKFFGKWNEIIEKNGGFLVGNKLSYADFAIATAIEMFIEKLGSDVMEKYPALQAHQVKVFSAPGIKEWVAKRPQTQN